MRLVFRRSYFEVRRKLLHRMCRAVPTPYCFVETTKARMDGASSHRDARNWSFSCFKDSESA